MPEPVTELDARYGEEGVSPVSWHEAERVSDGDVLHRVATAFEDKYGAEWHFDVGEGVFVHGPGQAHVFRVAPVTAYGFGKEPYSHTRWRF